MTLADTVTIGTTATYKKKAPKLAAITVAESTRMKHFMLAILHPSGHISPFVQRR